MEPAISSFMKRDGRSSVHQTLEQIRPTVVERVREGESAAKEMQAKIGQLTLEVDALEVALGRVSDASAKR
jgi:hypothetical protein